jgi:hypothetical protein
MHRIRAVPLLVVLAAAAAAPVFPDGAPLAADRSTKTTDRFWHASDLAGFPVGSIAFLPPATYDGNVEARRQVELAVGQALRGSGHRWASAFLTRDLLLRAGGDSILKAINDKLLKDPRVDSLDAPRLARILRTRALLSVRVDQLERRELEADQSGRPTTTVQLRGALVDSTGRLLWTVFSNETLEGSAQDPNANVIGVKASGLNTTAVGGTSAAPAYAEVLSKVCQRWADDFPRRAAPDTSRAAADSSRTGH